MIVSSMILKQRRYIEPEDSLTKMFLQFVVI